MPAQKKTSVSVTVANEIGGGREVCILIEMKIGADDVGNVSRCMRDLQRATQTFQLHADLEDKSVFAMASTLGPYFYNEQKNVIAIAMLRPQDGADETVVSTKIRTGVNGVASLLRQGTYRVKAKIKPVEQVVIPETESVAPAPAPAPEPVPEEPKA